MQLADDQFNADLTHLLKYTYVYLLIRFKLHYRQVSIVTHTDFDGAISAAIMLQKYPYSRLYFTPVKNLYKVLYIVKRKISPHIPHSVYILDLNVDEHYRTRIIKAIKDMRRDALVEIHWIDHHRSVFLDEMEKYATLCINPNFAHAANLVYKHVNNSPEAIPLLDILQNTETPFVTYWRSVLKMMLKSILNTILVESILRSLATANKTELTDRLFEQYQIYKSRNPKTVEKIYTTENGYKFGLLHFDNGGELYPTVRETLASLNLDFLLVKFENGKFSAYKNQASEVDLTPLITLVGGKGHSYAFHFDPQMRISDEFYQPLPIPDLIAKVTEVL